MFCIAVVLDGMLRSFFGERGWVSPKKGASNLLGMIYLNLVWKLIHFELHRATRC